MSEDGGATISSVPPVRPYRRTDLTALYDICVRTAADGADARGHYDSDDLVGDLYVGPYVELDPELAFVLDDGGRIAGFIVGTANTPRFADEFSTCWLPKVARRYRLPDGPPRSDTERAVARLYNPQHMVVDELSDYPAHLHINLLPEYQGKGFGRRLMEVFLQALAEVGVQATHLGLSTANRSARAFYDRLGFVELPVDCSPDIAYLGRETGH